MSFHFKREENMADGLRRIAHSQLQKANSAVIDADEPIHETIHELRKRCKKLRGLIRLVRPVFPAYKSTNITLRDAARSLSDARDAHSMIDTLDALCERYADPLDQEAFADLRQAMVDHRQRFIDGEIDAQRRVSDFRETLLILEAQVDDWRLDENGPGAIGAGLAKTYRRGRRALARAGATDSGEDFHQWRKRAKYHWYHLKLLRGCWPRLFKAWAAEAHRLSDLVGDDHDLLVLDRALADYRDLLGQDRLDALRGLIDQRSRRLRGKALDLGTRLYAEEPKAQRRRVETCWAAWRNGTPVQ